MSRSTNISVVELACRYAWFCCACVGKARIKQQINALMNLTMGKATPNACLVLLQILGKQARRRVDFYRKDPDLIAA